MIRYTKEEIDNLRIKYKVNEQLKERLLYIKNGMNKSSHININNKRIITQIYQCCQSI